MTFDTQLSRRALLTAGAGMILASALRPALASAADSDYRIKAAAAGADILGTNGSKAAVWAYNSTVPGPVLRLRQGKPVRILVDNGLPEPTTVHWHGIRLPIAMDGVPGISQLPILSGAAFEYEFTPPDAGTFWYHPHVDSLQQLGRGLSGALIVEEHEPPAVDRDVLWMLADWRLDDDGQIAAGFGNAMDSAMSGRIGNTPTLNGRVSRGESVRAGERIRLRLVNAAVARLMALRFEGHRPWIVATDGQPCEPHEPETGRLLLGPAMRIDVLLDMEGSPGQRYRVLDGFYDGLSYSLTELAYNMAPPLRLHPLDAPRALPLNPLPEPDLGAAFRHELVIQGGMMGGGAMAGLGGMMGGMMNGMGGMSGGGTGMSGTSTAIWAINGSSMTGDGQAGMSPLLTLTLGRSCVLTLRNQTAWWHPMHLHGHSFRVLSRNGVAVPHRQWGDTVLVSPREAVEIAFVADNPGDWMLHCHVMDHQVSGLMAILRIA